MHKPLLATEFLDRARRRFGPEEAVLTVDGERLTYDDLGERVDRLASTLAARGVGRGDAVAVLDPNTHYHLETAYAALQLGAVHTPLNYRLKPSEHEYILRDADVRAVVADWDYVDSVDPIRDDVPVETYLCTDRERAETDRDWIDVDEAIASADPAAHERPDLGEDDLATINYTSGTTGEPKGVMRTHRCETVHAYLTAHQQSLDSADVYYWTLPMFHVNGWGHVFAVTGVGARHVCTRGVDAADVFSKIAEENVSYLNAAPTVMNRLIEYYEDEDPEPTGDNPVRLATGGAAPPTATIRRLEDEMGWYFEHMYGLTETGPLICTSDFPRLFDQDDEARFEIKKRQGFGMLGTELDVVDEEGATVPRDDESVGEIVVRGNQVMEGYRNKPEATDEAFSARREGWFHTGDLATLNERGLIRIVDRKKDVIVSGGENISSLQLEDVLYEHPEVREVAVIPAPSDEWGETPKAVVVPVSGDPDDPGTTAADLREFTREHLANYKAISRVEFVAELPKTSTGKVQKYELREREWADENRLIGEG